MVHLSFRKIYKIKQRKLQHEEEMKRQQSPIYKGPAETATFVTAGHVPSQRTDSNVAEKAEEDEKLLNEINEAEKIHIADGDFHRNRSCSDASYSRLKHEDCSVIDGRYIPHGSPAAFSSLLEMSISESREDIERGRQTRRRIINLQRQTSQLSAISMTELPYIPPQLVDEVNEFTDKKSTHKAFFIRLLNTVIDTSLFKVRIWPCHC